MRQVRVMIKRRFLFRVKYQPKVLKENKNFKNYYDLKKKRCLEEIGSQPTLKIKFQAPEFSTGNQRRKLIWTIFMI
jgi:hypothetical protein